MGFRLFRRVKIAPGISLNFSKSGLSTSFGGRGAHVTVGRRGVRRTLGVPGTGMYYTHTDGWKHGKKLNRSGSRAASRRKSSTSPPPPTSPARSKLDLDFFHRLLTPKEEKSLVDGCKAYVAGDKKQALTQLLNATHLVDGAFLAGFLALDAKQLDKAEQCLQLAAAQPKLLGKYFDKYEMHVELDIAITESVTAHIHPCKRGVLLGLAEVYQAKHRPKDALARLKQLRQETPDDIMVNVAIAELVIETSPHDKRLAKQIVELAGSVQNESNTHAAMMFYKAQALRTLGLNTAARQVLTAAGRKKKDRNEHLLRSIRYERACVYEDMGQKAHARREFEKLYAQDPSFEDVGKRLGV